MYHSHFVYAVTCYWIKFSELPHSTDQCKKELHILQDSFRFTCFHLKYNLVSSQNCNSICYAYNTSLFIQVCTKGHYRYQQRRRTWMLSPLFQPQRQLRKYVFSLYRGILVFLKLNCIEYPAIHTNCSLSNCTIWS